MPEQSTAWSLSAAQYEELFIDPYRDDVINPLHASLGAIPEARTQTVADLGCGIGPLLPFLAVRFANVIAIDFAERMLRRAKQRCGDLKNVEFYQHELCDLSPWKEQWHVATAINSLVMPDVTDLDRCLSEIHSALTPGGRFLGIVPAMDSVHYYTMLLLDRALEQGKPLHAARKNAAHFADHETFDFAFGEFRYRDIRQHFWYPFEIRYRLNRAGFSGIRICKVELSWKQFSHQTDLHDHPPPWDWFFEAERK